MLTLDKHNKQHLLGEILLIGGPIALQNLFLNSLNLIDNLMVGQLGTTALAAVGQANQIYFIYMLLGFGIASGTTVFTSRYWGQGDRHGIRRVFRLALAVLGTGSVIFFVLSITSPRMLIGIYTKDPAVIELGARYLWIVGFSYPFIGLSNLFAAILRSTRDVKTPLLASSLALACNSIGNACLIYGLGPFPTLGVEGAAIATVASRILELGLLILLAQRHPQGIFHDLTKNIKLHKHEGPRLRKREYFATTLPVLGNEILWSTGYTMYAMVFGRMGTPEAAAYSILEGIIKISLFAFIGSANAAAIILGNTLGTGGKDQAQLWAKYILSFSALSSLVVSLIIAIFSALIPQAFNVEPEVRRMASQLLLAYAIVLPFKIVNIHALVSVLRSGGDTFYSLVVDAGTLWLIGVPISAILGLWLGLPAPLVYLGPLVEEGSKAAILIIRTWSGRWQKTVH